jgi:hypothetical protein
MARFRTVRGIRDKIPGGYVIGRLGKGRGAATLIPLTSVNSYKGISGAGGGGGSGASVRNIAVEMFVSKTMAASETVGQIIAPKVFTIPAGVSGSYAKARVASTGSVTLTIRKNGSSIGTITFTTSATGTFSFSSDVTFAIGDLLSVTTGGSVDVSLADTTILLYGSI